MARKDVVVAVGDRTVGAEKLDEIKGAAEEQNWKVVATSVAGEPVSLIGAEVEESEISERIKSLSDAVQGQLFDPTDDDLEAIGVALAANHGRMVLLTSANSGTRDLLAKEDLSDVLSTAGDLIGKDGPGGKFTPFRPSTPSPTEPAPAEGEKDEDKPKDPATTEAPPPKPVESELKELHAAMWEAVNEKPELAKAYFDAIVAGRTSQQATDRWAHSADDVLVNKLDLADVDDKKLLRQIVRARAGIPETFAESLYVQAVVTEEKRNLLLDQAIAAATTLNAQLSGWKILRDWAIGLMVVGTTFAIIMTIWLINGRELLTLEGYLLPILIFIFAIMAVSPAVLLLLGRPLAGIDQFMPGGRLRRQPPTEEARATIRTRPRRRRSRR